ncbi:MAG: AI-2E family transporter, partial [Clostridiales bacterium]|nr:AI-2E family transporter [Clostridiales bacterium]
QLDGNVIGPKILGNRIGISGFWVMFAIIFLGGTWGLLGMVIGVPLFAVIYDLIRKLVKFGLRKHGKQELWEQYAADYPNDNMPKPNEEPEPFDWSLEAMKERGLHLLEEAKKACAATVARCTKAWAFLKKWALVIWGYLKKAAQWLHGQLQRLTAKMRSRK